MGEVFPNLVHDRMGEVLCTNAKIHSCVHRMMHPHDLLVCEQRIYTHIHILSSPPVVQQQSIKTY